MAYRRKPNPSYMVPWRKGHAKGRLDGIAQTIDALDALATKRPDLTAAEAAAILRAHLAALRAAE